MGKYDAKIAKIKTALENVFVKIKQNTGNKTLSTDANGNVILENKNNHAHGQITKDGKISSDISSVNKVVVTDGSTVTRTISKLPADKVTHQDISGKANVSDLATVATSGSYNDLSHKPNILSIQNVNSVNDINDDGIYLIINGDNND